MLCVHNWCCSCVKDPLQSGVVTCGTIKGGYGYNIIADRVDICGTCRSFTLETQELIISRMKTICCGVAQMYGGEINVHYECMIHIFQFLFI